KTVAAMDVLAPGIGEIIGGSQREERLDVRDARMDQFGLEREHYDWHRDFRRYGTVPHAGFGLGFERLIVYVCGLSNIRDAIPYPRAPGYAMYRGRHAPLPPLAPRPSRAPDRAMILFLALCFVGVAIGGFTAFVIFWPLSLVHLRDRHPQVRASLGEGAFISPRALAWLLSGRYRSVPDPRFTGLATPARV